MEKKNPHLLSHESMNDENIPQTLIAIINLMKNDNSNSFVEVVKDEFSQSTIESAATNSIVMGKPKISNIPIILSGMCEIILKQSSSIKKIQDKCDSFATNASYPKTFDEMCAKIKNMKAQDNLILI